MKGPYLRSLEDLESISEDIDPHTQKVRYTTFELFHEGHACFGQIFKPKNDITLEEYRESLKIVPDREIFPELPHDSNFTIAKITESTYIKHPNLFIYELAQGTTYLADLLHEAQIMDQISQAPHPNIIGYHGIQVQDGRIIGFVFDRFQQNLLAHLKRGGNVEIGGFAQELTSAVAHIHSLDLVHNDINPENIMGDDNGSPILINSGHAKSRGCGFFQAELQAGHMRVSRSPISAMICSL